MFRILLYVAGAVIAAIVIVLALSARTYTPPFVDGTGKTLPNSIAEERRIVLGGWDQYVLVRSRNKANPILLFVHGGPGTPEMPLVRVYNNDLENDFVFVNWDQRGTGKSYASNIDPKTITLDQITRDLDQLVDQLRAEFGKSKVLFVCHSWGTQLCLSYLAQHANKASAYIAIGQAVNQQRSDQEGYDWALVEARRRGDQAAAKDLEDIGPPPYSPERVIRQRAYIGAYGGAFHKAQPLWQTLLTALKSPETSWTDYFAFKAGGEISLKALWGTLQGWDAVRDYPRLDVPTFFIHGRYDRQVSALQAELYFNKLAAPKKEFIWFENSAHSPPFEEPERFNAEVRRIAHDVGGQ